MIKQFIYSMSIIMLIICNSAYANESKKSYKLKIESILIKPKGDKLIYFSMLDKKNKRITMEKLKEVHTQKIHMLIIDDSLTNYYHIHPKEIIGKEGEFYVKWNPVSNNVYYNFWVDITPINSEHNIYIKSRKSIGKPESNKTPIDKTLISEQTINNLTFKLICPKNLTSGQDAMLSIKVLHKEGKPFKDLQVILGAFSHVVGFHEDLNTVLHAHEMEAPKHPKDLGGAELSYHVHIPKKGFYKLFAQFKIQNKDISVPFSFVAN
jgi:hypothetical protein